MAAGAAALASCGGAAAAVPPAATVVTFPGVARAFAAEDGRVAWIDSAWILHVRSVRSKTETRIRYTSPYQAIPPLEGEVPLVLGSRQLLLVSTRSAGRFYDAQRVLVGQVGTSRTRSVKKVVNDEGGRGGFVTGLAGDATGFSWGIVSLENVPSNPSLFRVSGGGVWTLTSGTPRRLPGAPPAIVLAESAGRVAIAPADTAPRQGGLPAAAGPLEIRDATSGALITTITPPGPLRAVALTRGVLAVLADGRLLRYDAASGRLLGSLPVSADVGAELAADGGRIAFPRLRGIVVVDAASGSVLQSIRTRWRPTGVALAGRTLAWVEQRRTAPGEPSKKTFEARIRTLALTPRDP